MKKVVSCALFWMGKNEHSLLYSNGLKAFCRAHHTLFPGWEWRVHHDGTLLRDKTARILLDYAADGLVRLVDCGSVEALCKGMVWRLLPAWDHTVSHFICRDLDALPTPREAISVKQFVDSGAALHCMNDNVQHGIPIMGGLCGFRSDLLRSMSGLRTFDAFTSGADLRTHGDDQKLIERKLWPALRSSLCEHRFRGYRVSPSAIKSYTTAEGVDLHWVPPSVRAGGDALIPFMGCAGYDYKAAEQFYDQHGNPELIARIKNAERKSE